jgi:fructose-1,6-bisphosphatase/inositol monophosphatase family enzyme
MQPMLNIANTAARKAGQLILRASEELDMVLVE